MLKDRYVYLYASIEMNESHFLAVHTQADKDLPAASSNRFEKKDSRLRSIAINSQTIYMNEHQFGAHSFSLHLLHVRFIFGLCFVLCAVCCVLRSIQFGYSFQSVQLQNSVRGIAKEEHVYIKYKYTPTFDPAKQRCEQYEREAHAFNKCKLTSTVEIYVFRILYIW